MLLFHQLLREEGRISCMIFEWPLASCMIKSPLCGPRHHADGSQMGCGHGEVKQKAGGSWQPGASVSPLTLHYTPLPSQFLPFFIPKCVLLEGRVKQPHLFFIVCQRPISGTSWGCVGDRERRSKGWSQGKSVLIWLIWATSAFRVCSLWYNCSSSMWDSGSHPDISGKEELQMIASPSSRWPRELLSELQTRLTWFVWSNEIFCCIQVMCTPYAVAEEKASCSGLKYCLSACFLPSSCSSSNQEYFPLSCP